MSKHKHYCIDCKMFFYDEREGCKYPYNYSCKKVDAMNGDW